MSSRRVAPGRILCTLLVLAVLTGAVLSASVVSGAKRLPPLVDITPGVSLATITDATLLDPQAPGLLSAKALRLDARRVRLRSVLANDRLPALERVLDIATRTGAVAAINAGFFTPRGGPAGLLVVDGQPIGVGVHPRGAVALHDDGQQMHVAIARAQLRLVPDVLATSRVGLVFWNPEGRDLSSWRHARDVIGGAGLLVQDGVPVRDVGVERMRDDFPVVRHPRSVIGVDADGAIWLVAVDGRRPDHSVGMSFPELQRMATMLGLRDAVNLDGGGSTTLVDNGEIVNRPTDLAGARAVSDALVVLPR